MNFLNAIYALSEPQGIRPKVPASDDYWMPVAASTTVSDVDGPYNILHWGSVVLGVVILSVMILFAIKYRAKSRKDPTPERTSDHNTTLEVTWSIIPLFAVIGLFVLGFKGYVNLRSSPKDSLEIHATGQKWKWLFQYPDGHTDDRLHVPVDRNVRIIIQSQDVIHSLYIPNFRVKMDAVPGRYTELWFHPNRVGVYPIFCAEYCGTGHSAMLSETVVHEPGGYERYLEEIQERINNLPPVELGKMLYQQQGCSTCHSVDGTRKVGPSWKGIFGKSEQLADGSSITIDENYIKESILDPQAKVVQSFVPSMPTYKGKLNDKQLNGLIEYIKSVQ